MIIIARQNKGLLLLFFGSLFLLIQNCLFFSPIFLLIWQSNLGITFNIDVFFPVIYTFDVIGLSIILISFPLLSKELTDDLSEVSKETKTFYLVTISSWIILTSFYRLSHFIQNPDLIHVYEPFTGNFYFNMLLLYLSGLLFWNGIILFTELLNNIFKTGLNDFTPIAYLYGGANLGAIFIFPFFGSLIGFLIKFLVVPAIGCIFYFKICWQIVFTRLFPRKPKYIKENGILYRRVD
ncbi:MAG: hypothetical protein ACXAC7_06475 [Candidatus Hodarchaeales archaeon]